MYHGSLCGCIYMYVYSFSFYENKCKRWAMSSKMSLREVIIIKGDISCSKLFLIYWIFIRQSCLWSKSAQSCDICYLFRDMHYSSGSTADKVTDPDKTKLAQAETSFVLSLSWWHKRLFNVDPGKKKRKN